MLIEEPYRRHRLQQAIANYHKMQAEFIAEELPQQQPNYSIMEDISKWQLKQNKPGGRH